MKISKIIRIAEHLDDSTTTIELTYPELHIIYECLVNSGIKTNYTDSKKEHFNKALFNEIKALQLFFENGNLISANYERV